MNPGGDPVSGQGHGLRANDTSVHHQRVDGSVDGRKPGADRPQIGDVHEDDVEDAPAGGCFELGFRCYSPDLCFGTPGRSDLSRGVVRRRNPWATSFAHPRRRPLIRTVLSWSVLIEDIPLISCSSVRVRWIAALARPVRYFDLAYFLAWPSTGTQPLARSDGSWQKVWI